MSLTITSDDVRLWSQLDFAALNYGTASPDPLDKEVARAISFVQQTTGRTLADTDVVPDSDLGNTFETAVQLRVEQQVTQRQPDFVADQNENAIDITVSGYAQRRIDPKVQAPPNMLTPWPELNDALIALMTEDKLAYWQAQGKVPLAIETPFEDVTELGIRSFSEDNPLRPWGY